MTKPFKIGDLIVRVHPIKVDEYDVMKIYYIKEGGFDVLVNTRLYYEVLCGQNKYHKDWFRMHVIRLATAQDILQSKANVIW